MRPAKPADRAPKKKPVAPRVKGAPLVCPHCEGVDITGVYLPVINTTLVGCRSCKKLRIKIPGKAV